MKKLFTSLSIAITSLITAPQAFAQGLVKPGTLSVFTKTTGKTAGFNPGATLGGSIAQIIQAVLGLLAIIFVIIMIVAGFRWMTASGNEEEVKKAQNSIKSALIGLIVVLAAWSIVYFIFTYLPFGGNSSSMLAS